jgi:hypothetical protein
MLNKLKGVNASKVLQENETLNSNRKNYVKRENFGEELRKHENLFFKKKNNIFGDDLDREEL